MIILFYIILLGYTMFSIASFIAWYRTITIHNTSKTSNTSFTIIIPARNEAKNIETCIESILHQSYPASCFEIIVVDDYSDDSTADVVLKYCSVYENIKLIQLQEYPNTTSINTANKKAGLSIAIDNSQNEWIVQTDADCIVPNTWLQQLNQAITPDIHVIAGPVKLIPSPQQRPSNLLYVFQSIDFMTMQLITAASHYFSVGRMSNGANMAFSKTTFYEVEGYKNIDKIASGDDMLLLQKITSIYPDGSTYLKHNGSIVETIAQASWYDFIQQRIRWSSKSGHYADNRLNVILLLVYLMNLSIPFALALGIFNIKYLHLSYQLLLIKIIVELIMVWPAAQFFRQQTHLWWFPFLQPLHIIYVIIAGGLGMFGKYTWKGRTIEK